MAEPEEPEQENSSDEQDSDDMAEGTKSSQDDCEPESEAPEPERSGNGQDQDIDYITAYTEFLRGERLADASKEGWEPISVYEVGDIFDPDMPNNYFLGGKYALFDMNGDGIPELHVRSGLYYHIYTWYEGELSLWYHDRNWSWPTDDGAILYTRYGAAPSRYEYQYKALDFLGNTALKIEFVKADINYDGVYDDSDDYIFNNVRVTKEQWEALAEPYLSVTSDTIEWFDLSYEFTHIQ